MNIPGCKNWSVSNNMIEELLIHYTADNPNVLVKYRDHESEYAREFLVIETTIEDIGCYPIDTKIIIEDAIPISIGGCSSTLVKMKSVVFL
jgi:hypothetical protein